MKESLLAPPSLRSGSREALSNASERSGGDFTRRHSGPLTLVAIVAAVAPILISVGLAILNGWMPVSDNAWQALQIKDVLSTTPPLLGAPSAAVTLYAGIEANAPGPMSFWVLAPFYRMSGWAPWGLLVGAAVINAGSVIGVALIARRRGGTLLVMWTMAFLAVMLWALRGQILHDIWNASIPILPLTLLLFASWWTSSGGVRSLPIVVLTSSFIAQSHTSYLGLGVALGLWSLIGLGLSLRADFKRTGTVGAGWRDRRSSALRWTFIAVGVAALCWVLPFYDQVAGHRNFSRLAEANSRLDKIGLLAGAQRFANSLGPPPFWASKVDSEWTVVETASAFQWLLALSSMTALATLFVVMLRRKQTIEARLVATCAVSLAAGLWSATQAPVATFELHSYRWLWPVGMFLWFTISWTAYQAIQSRLSMRAQNNLTRALAVGIAAIALLGTQQPNLALDTASETFPVVQSLSEQTLDNLPDNGPYLILASGEAFWHVGPGLMAELERHGIEARVEDDRQPSYWGGSRPFNGKNATGTLLVTGGPMVKFSGRDSGGQLIAFFSGGNPDRDPDRVELPGYGFAVYLVRGPP